MLASARTLAEKHQEEATAYGAVMEKLERDPARHRLVAESNRLRAIADDLRRKLRIGGAESGCGEPAEDPVDRQRLAKLCEVTRRDDAVGEQIRAFDKRHVDAAKKAAAARKK
jgi:hypothetical protein